MESLCPATGFVIMLRATESSKVVAGGFGHGSNTNQLCFPYGLVVIDDDQTIIVADWGNHRIVQWKIGEANGQVIADDEEPGHQLNQLNGQPT
ncbi:unnamed protein product [Didymodactylos carnosus]|uniref:Uncharacterized protein n=1 Tax=Didymodactylos carnosus TaxID=1234261 RepID=A0A815NUM4_9BILA|nr:unnamed protein product [Didymodactylos carnosus]CAF4317626.1 unnamed protein product [Didymodactylos carnosus]